MEPFKSATLLIGDMTRVVQRKRAWCGLTALILGISLGLPWPTGSAAAQADGSAAEPVTIEQILPAGAACFIQTSGVDRLLERCQSLNLCRLWLDPEVQAFFADSLDLLPGMLPNGGDASIPLQELWRLWRGKIALAWYDGLPLFQNGMVPDIVAVLDLGAERDAVMHEWRSLIDLAVWAKNLTPGEERYRDATIHTLDHPGRGLSLHYTLVDSFLVLSLTKPSIHRVIDLTVDGAPSLAFDPVFSRCYERTGGSRSDGSLYVNMQRVLDIIQPILPPKKADSIEILGLDQVEALSLTTTIEGGGSREMLFVSTPRGQTGLTRALSPQAVSMECLEQTPPEALFFLATACDLELLLQNIENLLEVGQPGGQEAFSRNVNAFLQRIGLGREDELASIVGHELTFFVSAPRSGGLAAMIPDMVLSLSIADEEAFYPVLDELVATLGSVTNVAESRFNDWILHSVTIPQRGVPLSPTLTVGGGRLWIASTAMTMKRHLRWMESGSGGLLESEVFPKAMAGTPDGATLLHFANLKSSAQFGYSIGAPLLSGALSNKGLPVDAALLPMTETITQYITNAGAWAVADDTGFLLSLNSPLGVGAALAGLATIAEGMFKEGSINALLSAPSGGGDNIPVVQLEEPALGEAFIKMHDGAHAEAEDRLTRWIAANPNRRYFTLWARRHRGECRMQLGRFDGAIEDYQWVAERDENSRGLILYEIARAWVQLGNADDAIANLTQAIDEGFKIFDYDPQFDSLQDDARLGAFFDVVIEASVFMRSSEYEEAEQLFAAWLFSNPYHELSAWAHKNRGDCLVRLDRHSEAIEDYEKAAEGSKIHAPMAYYNIACAYARSDDSDRAIQYLKRAVDAGFEDLDLIEFDSSLDSIRDDRRVKALGWRL